MEREFIQFVEQPSGETYLAARTALLAVEAETLVATDLAKLKHLLAADACAELLEQAESLPAAAAISPRVHFYAAEAAASLCDADRTELERFLFVVCLQGIFGTGDGSRHRPYAICHAADQLDVLEALGLKSVRRRLVQRVSSVCEAVKCSDGSLIWFDVTVVTGQPMRRRQARVRRLAASRGRQPVTRTPR